MFSSMWRNGFGVGSVRLVAAVVVGGLLLAGCSGGEEPSVPAPTTQAEQEPADTETTETSAPETVEPEERPVPEEPDAMKIGDKAGAIAAAEFFVEVIEYDAVQKDSSFFSKYAFGECTWCNEYKKNHQKRSESDFSLTRYVFDAEEIVDASFVGENSVMWSIPIRANISSEYTSTTDGELIKTDQKLTGDMYVGFNDDGWLLVEGDFLVE